MPRGSGEVAPPRRARRLRSPQATVLTTAGVFPTARVSPNWPIAEIAKTQARIRDSDTGLGCAARSCASTSTEVDRASRMGHPRSGRSTETPGRSGCRSQDVEQTVSVGRSLTQRGLHDMWARYVAALGQRDADSSFVSRGRALGVPHRSRPARAHRGRDARRCGSAARIYPSHPELLDRRPAWGSAAANDDVVDARLS